MALRELEFTSHNGTDTIQAWVYEPAVTPVAAVSARRSRTHSCATCPRWVYRVGKTSASACER